MKIEHIGTLIRNITANVNEYISNNISDYGIKQGQFEYFLLIYSHPGINQYELSRLKGVGKASVTKALKILENDGFVERKTNVEDKRNIKCFITEKGSSIVNDLMKIRKNTEADLFMNFTQEEKDMFQASLEKLYINSKGLIGE